MKDNFKENRDDVIEIDLVELLGIILHNLWLIIVSGVIVASLTLLVSYLVITPKYESVTKIYVINKSNAETMTYSDLQAGSTLTKDYKELVKSRPVLEEVIAETGIETELKDLEKQISVEIPTDTRIVSILVEDKDPYQARIIADSVRIAASKHIQSVMDTEAVNVVEEASLPIEKSSPNTLMNTAIGYVIGLFLAMSIVVVTYIMDDTIKTPDDVERFLGVSVLGTIPYSESDLSDKEDMEEYKRRQKNRKKKQARANEDKVYHSGSKSSSNSERLSAKQLEVEKVREARKRVNTSQNEKRSNITFTDIEEADGKL